jgi:hypothetical protein
MQKVLGWLSLLIAVGVVIFVIIFLISINSNEKEIIASPLKKTKEIVIEKPKQVWLDNFSTTKKLSYFYPVTEILVQVGLGSNVIKKIAKDQIYELSAPDVDPYQLFCLTEELRQNRLRHYLKKDKNGVELLIYSQNKSRLNTLVQSLKNYNISAKISLSKEDK